METIEVGAFEAKTHLSQLLDAVESGAEVRISRRGEPVAVLRGIKDLRKQEAFDALAQIRSLCRNRSTVAEILQLRDAGRER